MTQPTGRRHTVWRRPVALRAPERRNSRSPGGPHTVLPVVRPGDAPAPVRSRDSFPSAAAVQPLPAPAAGYAPAPSASIASRVGDAVTRIGLSTDPMRLSLFLLTIITVSRVHQHYPILAKLRPGLLLVAATTVYAFLYPKYLVKGSIFKYWPPRAVAAFGFWALLSGVFGISLGNSFKFVMDEYSKTLVYGFLLVAALRNAKDVYTIVLAYALSSTILVYFSQFVFQTSKHYGSAVTRLSNLYTYDANDLGLVLIIGLGMTLLAIPFTANRWVRWLLLVNTLGIASSIARSGSRGAFLGILFFGIGLLVLARTVSVPKRIGIVFAAIAALVLTAPPGYWEQMQTLVNPSQDYNMSSKDGRKELAKRGVGYMMTYPAFGLGINNFAKAECTISPKAKEHVTGTGLRCTPPHNTWVQAGAETGFPGLVIFCALVLGGIGAMLGLRRRLPRTWVRGDQEQRFLYNATGYLALSLLGFAVTCTFLTFAWTDPVYILAALMAGVYRAADDRLARDAAAGWAGGAVAAESAPAVRWWRGGLPPHPVPTAARALRS